MMIEALGLNREPLAKVRRDHLALFRGRGSPEFARQSGLPSSRSRS